MSGNRLGTAEARQGTAEARQGTAEARQGTAEARQGTARATEATTVFSWQRGGGRRRRRWRTHHILLPIRDRRRPRRLAKHHPITLVHMREAEEGPRRRAHRFGTILFSLLKSRYQLSGLAMYLYTLVSQARLAKKSFLFGYILYPGYIGVAEFPDLLFADSFIRSVLVYCTYSLRGFVSPR